MKADRLIRKTYLKKNALKPGGEVTVYDLVDRSCDVADFIEMSAISAALPQEADSPQQLLRNTACFETYNDVAAWSAALLQDSPVAKALWQSCEAQGWKIGFSDLRSNGFHLDMPRKTIALDHFTLSASGLGRSAYFRNTALLTLVRALRDIWHESRHTPFENEYGPEEALMLERVRAADCDTVTMLAAWELRGAGHAEVWRHLIGTAEGDMAMVFHRFLERDPSAFMNGAALAYAFRQWYADDSRVDGCDHEALESLDDILLAADDGYSKPFGTRKLAAEKIEALAVLPDGLGYLDGLGDLILKDPFFAGLRDEINQSHFFQLMYDVKATIVHNVPFRDPALARKLFPQGPAKDF